MWDDEKVKMGVGIWDDAEGEEACLKCGTRNELKAHVGDEKRYRREQE